MPTLKVELPEAIVARVEEAARGQGLSIEELIRRSLEEKLDRDSEFEKAAERVVSKNHELYERLS